MERGSTEASQPPANITLASPCFGRKMKIKKKKEEEEEKDEEEKEEGEIKGIETRIIRKASPIAWAPVAQAVEAA